MAQQLLDGADVVAVLQQTSSKAVAKCVAACLLSDARTPNSSLHLFLNGVVQNMMATAFEGARICGQMFCREEKLQAREWLLHV